MKIKNTLKQSCLVVALVFALMATANSQIIISSDIANNDGFAYVAYLDTNSIPVAVPSGTISYFWYTASNISTITSWTNANDWTTSSLASTNLLGTQSIGVGYGGAAGLFGAFLDINSLATNAVGKSFAAAITTSSGLLGVFSFPDVLPANRVNVQDPTPTVSANLADVNTTGSILVGNFNQNGSFVFGGEPNAGEAYILIPEPSTGALMLIGAVGLVALRRLRKV